MRKNSRVILSEFVQKVSSEIITTVFSKTLSFEEFQLYFCSENLDANIVFQWKEAINDIKTILSLLYGTEQL